jgi:hypothetical protein
MGEIDSEVIIVEDDDAAKLTLQLPALEPIQAPLSPDHHASPGQPRSNRPSPRKFSASPLKPKQRDEDMEGLWAEMDEQPDVEDFDDNAGCHDGSGSGSGSLVADGAVADVLDSTAVLLAPVATSVTKDVAVKVVNDDAGSTTQEADGEGIAKESLSDGGIETGDYISISISISIDPTDEEPHTTVEGVGAIDRLAKQGNSVVSCSWSDNVSSSKGSVDQSIQMTVRECVRLRVRAFLFVLVVIFVCVCLVVPSFVCVYSCVYL